ncbi:cyclase/dehydrase [Crinalium epipsammum PCC 9333]|uniref:Cyclase/dehydrase n=1 Tax=Crinalium epipsammum PCC 9333 TaxID=1173022 RepID=K9VZD0_9CYAN|nr:SRPBCC family protein [Crinalium epipsammum]AFZ13326.1 cyclase/dehydrase [Crinalium epipsammum PCC 9333]
MEIQGKQPNEQNQGDAERWASLIGGGALVLTGLRQGSLRGALMAIAGGGLVYHGATAQKSVTEQAGMNQNMKVEKTVTINKSAAELYHFWHNFENLPNFMKHLKSVKVFNETRSHWIANAPLGASVEWDADIIRDEENKLIAWASVEGADVDNSGFVRFTPAPGGRGTEVKVVIEYSLPGGVVAATIAKLFGEEPEQQAGDDLRRFKQLMEAGELATTEGQPSGRSK